jgi:uncharacterized membrane protein YuzA (DUF378 family)
MKMNALDWIAWILVLVGAINWGLIGAFNYNLVGMIFGLGIIAQWIYILVGLAALYIIWMMLAKKGKKK